MANTLVNAGRDITTNRIKGSGTEPNNVAWGTGTGGGNGAGGAAASVAVAVSLRTESAEARTAGTSSRQQTTTANDTYRVVGTITATGTRAITEAGLLDASSGGNLFIYSDFSVINLASGDQITFTFNTSFS